MLSSHGGLSNCLSIRFEKCRERDVHRRKESNGGGTLDGLLDELARCRCNLAACMSAAVHALARETPASVKTSKRKTPCEWNEVKAVFGLTEARIAHCMQGEGVRRARVT